MSECAAQDASRFPHKDIGGSAFHIRSRRAPARHRNDRQVVRSRNHNTWPGMRCKRGWLYARVDHGYARIMTQAPEARPARARRWFTPLLAAASQLTR